MAHELSKHPFEVAIGIGSMGAHLLDKGVDDRTAPAGVLASDKHPVLMAKFGRPDRVLHAVVVEVDPAVLKTRLQLRPLVVGIMERLAQGASWGDSVAKDEVFGESGEVPVAAQRPSSSRPPSQFATGSALPLPRFEFVDFADLDEHPCADAGLVLLGLNELAPDVRQTADGLDPELRMLGHEGAIRAVAITLKVAAK